MLTSSPVQTAYSRYRPGSQNGMLASAKASDVIDTGISDMPAGQGIGFGLAVSQGAMSDQGVVLGTLSGGTFRGITIADPTLANRSSTFTDKYEPGENVAVLVNGDIWVVTADAVVPGAVVKFSTTTGALSTGTGTTIANAEWRTTQATPGGLAVVRLGNTPKGA